MGIEVSATKAVSINVTHEHGVDTSIARNPAVLKFAGMFLMHIFRRNQRGTRADDGNPLIYAVKKLNSFTITPHWESWLFRRALAIVTKQQADLARYNVCIPVPSSSPFCGRFADVIANHLGIPVIVPDFIKKRTIGAVLAEALANPAKVRQGLQDDYKKQLQTWGAVNGDGTY